MSKGHFAWFVIQLILLFFAGAIIYSAGHMLLYSTEATDAGAVGFGFVFVGIRIVWAFMRAAKSKKTQQLD
tara:strand:- start:4992 stop:5204 length:213 start_codon:yes stop_codon:yes gene_type:complete